MRKIICVEDVIMVGHVFIRTTGGVSAAVTLRGQDPIVKVNKQLSIYMVVWFSIVLFPNNAVILVQRNSISYSTTKRGISDLSPNGWSLLSPEARGQGG